MYKLARNILMLLLLTATAYEGSAQVRPIFRRPPNYEQRSIKRQNRIEQVREAYLGQRLALTPAQAAKFWPLYRQYQDALTVVRQKKRQNNSSTTIDGTQQIQNELNYETELVNIRKYYTTEFLKILPAQKVSEMFKAEREFTDELIKQLRERRAATNVQPSAN
jgi:hypothetical protein